MKTIVYPGPGHVLKVGERRIRRGVPTEVSEELYRQLQRDPSMTLQVIPQRRERQVKPAAKAAPTPAVEADAHADNGEEEETTHG